MGHLVSQGLPAVKNPIKMGRGNPQPVRHLALRQPGPDQLRLESLASGSCQCGRHSPPPFRPLITHKTMPIYLWVSNVSHIGPQIATKPLDLTVGTAYIDGMVNPQGRRSQENTMRTPRRTTATEPQVTNQDIQDATGGDLTGRWLVIGFGANGTQLAKVVSQREKGKGAKACQAYTVNRWLPGYKNLTGAFMTSYPSGEKVASEMYLLTLDDFGDREVFSKARTEYYYDGWAKLGVKEVHPPESQGVYFTNLRPGTILVRLATPGDLLAKGVTASER